MPRNASGEFSLTDNAHAVSQQPASSSYFNDMIDDIATELTGSLARDGTGSMLGNLDMGGFQLTNWPGSAYYRKSVMDFANGATINDGTTDARAAILAGLQWCLTNNAQLYFPGGRYSLSAAISLTNYFTDMTEELFSGFGICGDGPRTSIIVYPSANTTGGIFIAINGGTHKWFQGVFQNFGIQVEGTKTYDIFTCTSTALTSEQFNQVIVQNVDIWGTDGTVAVTSGTMLNLNGIGRVFVDKGYFVSFNGTTTWADSDGAFTCKRAISADFSYAARFHRVNIIGARTGISLVGNSEEGAELCGVGIGRSMTGVRWIRGGFDTITPITAISKANPGVVTYTPLSATVTMTIASPAVVTETGHDKHSGTQIVFSTTGALPTGVTAGTSYYVISAGLTSDEYEFSATPGGAAVNTSGSQSGVHTVKTHPIAGDNVFLTGGDIVDAYDREFMVGTVTTASATFQLKTPIDNTNVDTSAWSGTGTGTFRIHGTSGQEPGPRFFGSCSMHCREACIDMSGVSGGLVESGNDFIVTAKAATPYNGYGFGIWMKNYDDVAIVGPDIGGSDPHNNFCGIFLDAKGFGQGAIIRDGKLKATGNTPSASSRGIWIGADDTDAVIDGMRFAAGFTVNLYDETAGAGAGTSIHSYRTTAEPELLTFEGTSSSSVINPKIGLYRNSPSPADADILLALLFDGNNDNATAERVTYGKITGRADDVSDSTEDGGLNFYSMVAGTETLVGGTTATGLNALSGYSIAGTKVVGAQGALIADASGGAVIDAEARTALNALLARLRAHGLIAT